MLPKDYVNYILTGVHACDYSDASGMLLLDVEHKCWSKEMLDLCGITEAQMPKLFESYEVVMPRVIKSDGKNEPFDEAKLRRSLMHALQKRPVTQEQIETVLSDIQLQIRRLGERDVKSRTIGEIVMQSLFALDHVAYVRFASVYQDFQDVEAFRHQIEQMQQRELQE